jgi:hypothetical protein
MTGSLEFLIVLAVLGGLVLFLTAPLRRTTAPDPPEAASVAELEAAREAKYRELRDAELDHSTGKLSDADYEEVDRNLRAEAIEILRALDHERALPSHGP